MGFFKDIQKKIQPHFDLLDPAIVICNSLGMHNGMARKSARVEPPFQENIPR